MMFDEYISNPMGKKNAVFGNREMYRSLYSDKLDKIMVRELGRTDYTLYINSLKDEYYIHFKIPSEVVPNFYYDTVIMFYTSNIAYKVSRDLKKYEVKFYSNDPSFVYTFAHAFLENDLFIRDLVPRMSKDAVVKVASEKNPRNEVGYVKSIYFSYLLATRLGLFNKIKYEVGVSKYSKSALLKNVEHADIKIKARVDREEELRAKKKKDKSNKADERAKDMKRLTNNPDIQVSSVTKSRNTLSSNRTQYAKKAKRI